MSTQIYVTTGSVNLLKVALEEQQSKLVFAAKQRGNHWSKEEVTFANQAHKDYNGLMAQIRSLEIEWFGVSNIIITTEPLYIYKLNRGLN